MGDRKKGVPISFIRIFLYLTALIFFSLVVINWWWAYYHEGYVVISFKQFGEMEFEFFLIHSFLIILIILIIYAVKREI